MKRFVTADRIRSGRGVLGDTLVVSDGVVETIGDRRRLSPPPEMTIDHPGAVIVPGLVDSHLHPIGYAAAVHGPTLGDARDFADLEEALASAAGRLPPGGAVVALRLDEDRLAEGRLPTSADVDRWVGDRPVLIYRYCGHVAVANRAALRLAGVDESVADPEGGSFDRDRSGRLTGVLRETAIGVVATAVAGRIPTPSTTDLVRSLRSLAGSGLTRAGAIVAAGSHDLWCGPTDEVALLAEIAAESPIDLHLFVATDEPERLVAAARLIEEVGPSLHFAGVKIFADGSLGGRTAALHRPYDDAPDTRGMLRLRPDRDLHLILTAGRLGGTAAVHAIGDRAIDETLELIDRIPSSHPPVRIEHVSLPTSRAITRMAAAGVVASVQPPFLASEATWLPGRIGERTRRVYPFASLRRAGILTVGGSDSPVERPDPLHGIHAARTRHGIAPSEALDGPEALSLYTDDAHRAFGLPPPLVDGSPADFVVLDGDPAVDDASTLTIRAVWKAGRPLDVSPLPWPG